MKLVLTENEKNKIRQSVIDAYKRKYPDWEDVWITDIVDNRLFGVLVSIASAKYPDGEICIYRKKDCEVLIFDSTPQLLNDIDRKASTILTSKELLVFIIVIWILGIFTGIVFYFRDDGAIALVTTGMAGILGTFAGVKVSKSHDND